MKNPIPPLFFAVRLPTLLAIFWRKSLTTQRKPEPQPHGPRSIVVFRLDALGDVVMTTPLFRELKRAYPQARITVVVQEAYKAILVTNPHVDEILTVPARDWRWLPERGRRLLAATWLYWTRLRGRVFDLAISPRWEVDEHLATFLCALTDAEVRLGYTEKTSAAKQELNGGFDAVFTQCLPPGRPRHEVLRNLAVLEALGGSVEQDWLEVRLTQPDRRFAEERLANVPRSATLIAVGIGAGSAGRKWPLEFYAKCITRLAEERWVEPVIVCSAPECLEATALARMLMGQATIVSGASLREVCAVLQRCHLFIGNDSGCAHLAAAMNCRTLVVSRHPQNGNPDHPNSPVRFAPYCNHSGVLQPEVGLDGCGDGCHSLRPHCIATVRVEDVVAAARQMLHLDELPVARVELERVAWSKAAARRVTGTHSAEAVRRAAEGLQNPAGAPVRRP